MAVKKNDIFELKFEGSGINPNKVKPSEVATLIQDFENALLGVIKQEYPAIDQSGLFFTFDKIENKSLGLIFRSNNENTKQVNDIVNKSYGSLSVAISRGDFSKYNNDTISSLKRISDFTKKYGCIGNFNHNGIKLTAITPGTEIKFNKPQYLKGTTTLYGELIDAGGDNPNIHLKINDDYIVIIKTDRQKTKELAARLYDQVGLKGEAKWDVVTSKIIEFKLYEVLDFKPGNIKSALQELRNLTSGVWDNYNSNDAINKKLLR